MIKTIIFDIGNVLINFDWTKYTRSFLDEETANIITHAMFGGPYWSELDRGLLTGEEILEKFIELEPNYEAEIRMAFSRLDECVERHDYAIPWIEEYHAEGYQVLYLSNYSEYVISHSQHALDFLPYMDGGVYSCDVHSIKPEREIYDEIVRQYDLVPSECIFIDDSRKNIDKAIELGFHGVHFENYDQAHVEVNALLQQH